MRPDGRGQSGGVDRATVWLFDAIKRQLNLACGLPVEVMTAAGDPAVRTWLETSRHASAAHRYWARTYQDLPQSSELDAILVRRLRGRFCVGYELPPGMRKLLDSIGAPYIDLRLHPVRFLDDLLFAARASEPATQAALLAMAEPEADVLITAGLREAMCHMISEA